MSKENGKLMQVDRLATVKAMVEKGKASIAAVLPKHMSAERIAKITLVAASRNPKLLECDPKSILRAVMDASQLGLEPFTGLQMAYIIPYWNGKTGVMEAQFMPSYRGLIDLARRSGNIVSIEAHVVFERDQFECSLGLHPTLKHVPAFDSESRGAMRLVYAVAHLKDGGIQYDIMSKYDVDQIRAKSKSSKSGPWVDFYDEMAKKTVVKRLIKYLPMSVELSRATSLDDRADGEIDVIDVDGIELPEIEVTPQSNLATKVEERDTGAQIDALRNQLREQVQTLSCDMATKGELAKKLREAQKLEQLNEIGVFITSLGAKK
jgi:recombination protein RecT